jgi:hypothetical protein
MSYGAFVNAARQERQDAKTAARRVLADRAAERVAARAWVEQVGLIADNGQPCPWAIQAALRLRRERGPGNVTRSLVLAAANLQKRRAWEWVGDDKRTAEAA